MASSYLRTNAQIRLPSMTGAGQTLYSADSGKTVLIPAATANGNLTLPALEAGLYFKLIMTATAGFIITVQSPTINVVFGNLIVNNAGAITSVIKSAATSFNITATAVSSDFVEITCDGTNYNIFGMSRVAAGLA